MPPQQNLVIFFFFRLSISQFWEIGKRTGGKVNDLMNEKNGVEKSMKQNVSIGNGNDKRREKSEKIL